MTPFKTAFKISGLYVLVGLIWILFSDRALELMVHDRDTLTRLQTYKGWAYVLVTGGLLCWISWWALRRQRVLAERDNLTGLLNWYMFRTQLAGLVDKSRENRTQTVLAVINIDGFRQYNSRVGHRRADETLLALSEQLRQHLPPATLISRVAADEFAAALNGHNAQQTMLDAVQALQQAVQAQSFEPRSELRLTCSAGLATYPQDAKHAKELITAANLALSESKEASPGSLREYRESYGTSLNERLQLTLDLGNAIANGEISMVYQPQFHDGEATMRSVEALVRWSHPVHGAVAPDVFIPLAEQQGLIGELTDFVCHQATQELASHGVLPEIDHLSINVSAQDLNDNQALERFVQRFAHLPKEQLQKVQLEITETSVMHNLEAAISLLTQLKAMGIRIAVDDFGTGYSSLGVISQLPVDELKIDRVFVRDMEHNDNAQLIVKTIIVMAHSLGLEVVAEGVENQQQMRLLNELGCDTLQGYYLGRPVPVEQLKALYATRHPST